MIKADLAIGFGDWAQERKRPEYKRKVFSRVDRVIKVYASKGVDGIADDFMCRNDNGEIDLETILSIVDLARLEYTRVSDRKEKQSAAYSEKSEKLSEAKFFISLRVFNKLLLDLYSNGKKIERYFKDASSRDSGCESFVKEYSDKAEQIHGLLEYLVNHRIVIEKKGMESKMIASDMDKAYIGYMRGRLKDILKEIR